MKILYPFLFSLFGFQIATATVPTNDVYEGYIVTLDGKKLTGQIGEIFFSDELSVVLFINDFGTSYHLQAELINGFVFEKDDEIVEYESLFRIRARTWSFLRVVERGAVLSLFQSPEDKMEFRFAEGDAELTGYNVQIEEYWLKFRGERSFKVSRSGYKRLLRLQLKAYPAVTKMLGKPGYKFKDMETIVQAVNEIYLQRKSTL